MKTALLLATLFLTGGCAMMRYDSDDAPPPPVSTAGPTTVPAEDARPASVTAGGLAREIFIDFPKRAYEYLAGTTPRDAALKMETAKTPDTRREGLTELAERPFGRGAPYTERYQQIGRFDDDANVRAAALRALNRSRDGVAKPLFVESLKDASPRVRLEAAKALANVPDSAAVPSLLAIANNPAEPADNRIAAVDALRHHRSLENARALINLLTERDFGIAWQARQSLRAMTGADRFYSQSAWLELLSGSENPLS
ncbi:MAG TPA: HEAT repeat domain-containing protein [Tepidisphaeraceae bacterium]